MPPNAKRAKPVRTSSALTFYNWGAPPSDYYATVSCFKVSTPSTRLLRGKLTEPQDSIFGAPVTSSPTGSRPSTPAQHSRDGTPQASAGPARNPRRRASHKVEEKILSSSHSTPRNLGPNSPLPIVSSRASKPPHINTRIGHGQQQVRFDGSPEVIEPSPDSEYGMPGGVDPDIWKAFVAADTDRSGLIDPDELRTALVNSPWNKPFDKETIDMLINIFDINRNKAIEFNEGPIAIRKGRPHSSADMYQRSLSDEQSWRAEFEKADRDGSGTIDARELKKALARFGYNLPLRIIKQLHRKHASLSGAHNDDIGITFDQFMRACVSVADFGKTFEQFNGPRNEQNKAKFEAFISAAFSICRRKRYQASCLLPPSRRFEYPTASSKKRLIQVMPHIPAEIIAEIATQPILEATDVLKCSLVSKAFCAIFQPRLYDRLVLFDGDLSFSSFKPDNIALLQSLSTRPDLANHAKTAFVLLDDLREDSDIPKILNLIPRLAGLRLAALQSRVDWQSLSAEMKSAVTRACQLPSLRGLQIHAFTALPSSLLRTNSELHELSISNIHMFTENEPHHLLSDNLNAPAADVAPKHFMGIRQLSCSYSPGFKKHQWLTTAIQSSGAAGSLQSLSLRCLVPILPVESPIQHRHHFDRPFDLSLATNLVSLHLQGVTGYPLMELDDGKTLFEDFSEFVLGTVATIETTSLKELFLHFTVECNHSLFLQPAFWDIPAWGEICNTIGKEKATKRLKRLNTSFSLELHCTTLPAEAFRDAIISNIKERVLEMAPAFNVAVFFAS
ncbi:hypothetical protein NMY22_g6985 [Coprinellus aureogranulatus]|nr:hypothetical protein NMY22_g6985 [Coprinellus aureogranulatus]